MGGHHKKELRAEKAKVKLKGAKLPKGLNVTKTDFKVRKIRLREQLSEAQYIDGQWQVNLKEILSRLKHHSPKFRVEAMRHLREVSGHCSIPGRMHDIIQAVASLSLDIEREPRRESFNTLAKLFRAVTVEAISPFFHVISSYLRCAMTHIQPNIQEDSLLLLDVLLEHVPQLVAEESGKIFSDFLQMISRVRAEGEANRTLTVNMGQKQTTIKWRTKVLQRLQLMLRKQYELQQMQSYSGGKTSKFQLHTFNRQAPQHFPLKRTYGMPDISDLFSLTTTTDLSKSSNYLNDPTSIRFCMEHLMPLLIEAWIEVRPQEHKSTNMNMTMGAELLLSNDAALTLRTVLDIIENLWSLVDLHETSTNSTDTSIWFRKAYAEAFATNFVQLNVFPYQQRKGNSEPSRKSKKNVVTFGDEQCLHQNITMVYLMCRFFGERISKKSWKYFNVLTEYLHTIVDSLKNCDGDQQCTLVLALRAQLLQCGQGLLQILPEKLRALLRATISAFLQQEFTGKAQSSMLITLCDIVQKPDLVKAYGSLKEFDRFLQFLPQLLLKPTITQDALRAMSTLSQQRNEQFLHNLSPLTSEIIDNIAKIQIHGAVNAFEGKKYIMNFFYWIETPKNVEELCEQITETISDKRIVSYFKYVLMKHEY